MSDYYFDEEEIQELLKENDAPVFDDFFNDFAAQDSSPPADEILPADEVLDPLLVPTSHMVHTSAPDPAPHMVPSEETLRSSHPHHLLRQNMESNHVMLSGDSSHHKKYEHWTIEEHKSFLFGLEIKKEKRWKQISEKYVPSKTAWQVASHAQKYFKRKNTPMKERKRRSIHDTILEDIDIIRIDQQNLVPPTSNFIVQPHAPCTNWVPSTPNFMVQPHAARTHQHNWVPPPPPPNFSVQPRAPRVDQDNWVSPPSNLAAQSCTAHIDQYTWDPPPPNFAVQPPTPHIDQHNWVPSPPNFAPHTSLVDQDNWVPTPSDFAVQSHTRHIDQHNWVPPPPIAVQPHEMQRAQHMQQFNLHSSSPQMDEYRNFNSGHP
ncbi:Myb-like protein J [Glycine soja]|uniref:Myb-like protein J n=1 Tax=Glycine soja TaxID=3848 RepID=A0A0B2P2V3_GLYSO|nr:Myb-like protein J [Glycine soja]